MRGAKFLLAAGWVVLDALCVQAQGRKPPLNGMLVDGTIVHNLSTGKVTIVTAGRFENGYGELDGNGYLSPDGRTILFSADIWRNHSIISSELRTVDLDGKNERVWYKAQSLRNFCWSPDGRFIFSEVIGPENLVLFIDTQTENARLIKLPKEFISPVDPIWSRDGKSLFYARSDGASAETGFTIMRMDLNGENAKPLINFQRNGSASLSPDEKTVAFIAPFERDLYLVDVATNKMRLMGRTRPAEIGQFWSPDGKWVGVEQETQATMDPSKIYLVNIETGKWQFLMKEHVSSLTWWQPPIGPLPDCERIVREQLGAGQPLKAILQRLSLEDSPGTAKPAKE